MIIGVKQFAESQRNIVINTYTQNDDHTSGNWGEKVDVIEGTITKIVPRLLSIGNTLWYFYVGADTSEVKYTIQALH